jgi:hypothetical protein
MREQEKETTSYGAGMTQISIFLQFWRQEVSKGVVLG